MSLPLQQSNIGSLPFLHRGKVRDIYAVGDDKLLVVQTDRLIEERPGQPSYPISLTKIAVCCV